jgi:hypothetical protein
MNDKRRVQVYREITQGTSSRITRIKEEAFQADFHQWADVIESDSGEMEKYTVALVEKDDGTIVEVKPQMIRFLDRILG